MSKTIFFILIILILGLGFYYFLIKEKEKEIMIKETGTKGEISIITVYDNYLFNPKLETSWGFSALIKLEDQNILFDTGANSETLLSNMEKLEIDPQEIDFVFISHLHGDHTGGLSGILEIKPDLKVYKPESFSGPREIMKGIYTTGPLGAWIKEQSLILNTEKGLVIITGCAHPGVVNIVKKAKGMFPEKEVYLVLGGFHLTGASDSELKNVIEDFRELGVAKVAPCHCSGDRCRELSKQEYGKDYIENGVGKIIKI